MHYKKFQRFWKGFKKIQRIFGQFHSKNAVLGVRRVAVALYGVRGGFRGISGVFQEVSKDFLRNPFTKTLETL